ncbi:MAG: hypothetical protein DRN78_03290 [Thermoproteota archaeon]|nr:hypothetical protein [Candidatus Korarchaeota archaeon]RLG42338.1 MAG: hypothetical protein DRN78_03290 [Candidatus Korarchaeota archaeon]
MSEKSDRVKRLLMLRDFLKKRLRKLEKEVIELRKMMEVLDEILLEQTLVTADQLKAIPQKLEERELLSDQGNRLGIIRIDRGEGTILFLPSEGVLIDARERPIRSFLLRKIEEYGARPFIEEASDGTLKNLRIEGISPKDIDKMVKLVRWALAKSVVQ